MKLTQKEFSNKIGFAQTSYSQIENGVRSINDRTIKLVCQEFNVNEYWLTTGQGDMFIQTDVNVLSEIEKQYSLDTVDKQIIIQYLKLNEFERKVIKDYMFKVFNGINE